jgi:hypothetical protein
MFYNIFGGIKEEALILIIRRNDDNKQPMKKERFTAADYPKDIKSCGIKSSPFHG